MTVVSSVARRAHARHAFSPALAFAVVFGASFDASADERKSTADRLFDEGKTLLDAGDWPGGCAKFQASFDADPAVSTSIKLARCRVHEGKLAAALIEYRRASELNRTLPQAPKRVRELDALIRTELSALEPRVPKILVEITPQPNELEVWVNGASVPPSALGKPLDVDPGEPDVVVRARGYREERLKPRVSEGEMAVLAVRLVPEDAALEGAAAPAPSARRSADAATTLAPVAPPPHARDASPDAGGGGDSGSGSWRRTLGLVAGGAGITTLGVAGYFGVRTVLLVSAASPRCPDRECDRDGYEMIQDAGTAQTIGFVTGGIGAALLITGTTLYLGAPSRSPDSRQTAVITRLGPGGATLEVVF